jgi:hypothetical protein
LFLNFGLPRQSCYWQFPFYKLLVSFLPTFHTQFATSSCQFA